MWYLTLKNFSASVTILLNLLNNDIICVTPDQNIISKLTEVKDLGLSMFQSCDFDSHIASITKKC